MSAGKLGAGKMGADRKLLIVVGALALVLVVLLGIIAPNSTQEDTRPTTTNTYGQGAKAAYLLLASLAEARGTKVERWEKPLAELDRVEASRTTLVLAEPEYNDLYRKAIAEGLESFVKRGGHVLATGYAGAQLLPGGKAEITGDFSRRACTTTPEGPGPLAAAGPVKMAAPLEWANDGPQFRVEQRCDDKAVVVRYPFGAGQVVWWASPDPLTNEGLKTDGNLKLVLASVGEGRDVLFDESMHQPLSELWDQAAGLPIAWLWGQGILVAVLLVFSFGRRRGPVVAAPRLPRTSPLEFARSMGSLYAKAGATAAATEAARRRVLRILEREAGLSQALVAEGPAAIAEALAQRLGGDWSPVRDHLKSAASAVETALTPRDALTLVKAMCGDVDEVRARLRPAAAMRPAAAVSSAVAR